MRTEAQNALTLRIVRVNSWEESVVKVSGRAFLFSETGLCHIVREQMKHLLDDADIAQCGTCKETKVVRTVLDGAYVRVRTVAKDKGIRYCARCYFKLIGLEPEGNDEQVNELFAQHARG